MHRKSNKKMAGSAKLKQLKSSWTPLSNEEANHKIFEERRDLVCKWFDKWSDVQRKQILEDLISRCKVKQLVHADKLITERKPVFHQDPTLVLPRVITIYVFSFLDPRSLCRCAQVSWAWHNIAELDQLWMPKAIRRNWILPFSPGPYEVGTWKRLYIENAASIKSLRQPKDIPDTVRSQLERMQLTDRSRKTGTPRARPSSAKGPQRPPWKGSDPEPKDTWRNNYLDNDDEVTKIKKLRKKGIYGPEFEAIQQRAKNKVNTGTHIIKRSSSLPRSKSALAVHEASGERPDWAKSSMQSPGEMLKGGSDYRTVSVTRPSPVKAFTPPTKPAKVQPRTVADENLFEDQPWQIPQDGYDSDT